MTTTTEREYLAQLYEGVDPPASASPDVLPEDLVLRARSFFEARVVELGARDAAVAARAAFDLGADEAAAEAAVQAALARSIEQARRETAVAIRNERI